MTVTPTASGAVRAEVGAGPKHREGRPSQPLRAVEGVAVEAAVAVAVVEVAVAVVVVVLVVLVVVGRYGRGDY